MGIQVIHCFDSVGLSLHARAPGLPISLKHMEDLHTALLFFFQLKQSKKPEIRKQTNKQKRKRLYYLKLHLSLLGWIGSVLSADDLRGQGAVGPWSWSYGQLWAALPGCLGTQLGCCARAACVLDASPLLFFETGSRVFSGRPWTHCVPPTTGART